MKMRRKSKANLQQQLEIKHELNCHHCGKEFKYESERRRHEHSHSAQFACKVCNKKFSFMSALRRHEKQHERTGSVCCSHCDRKFRDDSLLKRHIKYAHKGIFTCIKCNGVFNSDLALHSHMKIHNPESERKYRCRFEGCTKTFNFPHHLKHHELTHTNTKQYFCSICEKGFIQYHHMKSHLKTHKPNSWLACPFPRCEKTYATDASLRKHMSKHRNTNTPSDINKTDKNDSSEDSTAEANILPINAFIHSGIELSDNSSQLDWREQYLGQDNQFTFNENIGAATNFTTVNDNNAPPNNICKSEDEELLMIHKVNTLEIKEDVPISNCKASLGGCIMGEAEDTNDKQKCLCAQITNTISIEDTYDLIANNKCCTSAKKRETNVSNLKPVKINNNCDSCGRIYDPFADINVINENNNTDIANGVNDVIDYKSDGTVKIKEVSDMSINSDIPAYSSGTINVNRASDNIPFNSCKAVLGTCIVSGNGTIDDSCLCAKMAMDDQQMMDQEIDELTPCPKV